MHSCNWLNLKDKEELWKDVNTGPFWVEGLWVMGFVSSGLSGFFYDEYRLSVQLKKGMILIEYLMKESYMGQGSLELKLPSRSSPPF